MTKSMNFMLPTRNAAKQHSAFNPPEGTIEGYRNRATSKSQLPLTLNANLLKSLISN